MLYNDLSRFIVEIRLSSCVEFFTKDMGHVSMDCSKYSQTSIARSRGDHLYKSELPEVRIKIRTSGDSGL